MLRGSSSNIFTEEVVSRISTKELGSSLVKHVLYIASKSNLSASSKFTMNLILLITFFKLTVPAHIEGRSTNSLKADADYWH